MVNLLLLTNRNDGNNYEGEFLNNLKHGFGVFNYSDGSRYEG